MNIILNSQYTTEKETFTKLLMDTRMVEVTYSETFSLLFYKPISNSEYDNYKWKVRKMNLIVDAPFWVGEKSEWEAYIKEGEAMITMSDEALAYELVNIRYNNLIQVNNVEFFEKYLCISLDNGKILCIAYDSDSDYSWILEEYNEKKNNEKMMVFCTGNQIFSKNISEIL